MDNNSKNGTLYICATPIGNLEDITLRALRVLREVDFIASEDTRHTAKLLNYYKINTPMVSYHEHNSRSKGVIITGRLKNGENAALVSDAGMPAISDPGNHLIRLCIEENINITVCPGASASLAALVLSGLDTKRFCFEGFLPQNKKERRERLSVIAVETGTSIIYEAPHRLYSTLLEIKDAIGENRHIAIVREITKTFEQAERGSASELCGVYSKKEPKGEFVIVIEGKDLDLVKTEAAAKWLEMPLEQHVKLYIDKGLPKKDAMKLAAKDRGVSKSKIYAYMVNKPEA